LTIFLLGVGLTSSEITHVSKRYFTDLNSLGGLLVVQFENPHPFSGN
jgi:hypothetical protein